MPLLKKSGLWVLEEMMVICFKMQLQKQSGDVIETMSIY